MGDDQLYSCDAVCACVVDALEDRYPDKDLATLLARLGAGQQDPDPELDQVGRDCALQSSLLPGSGLDPFSASWYSTQLRAAEESPIEPTGREDAEVYRLLVLPSFTSPIIVRIERVGKRITYTTKRLSGQGGYEPGEIDSQASGTVSRADWIEFKRLMIAGEFWTRLSHSEMQYLRRERCNQGDQSVCSVCFDGTRFVLEGTDESRYKVVDRHNAFEEPLESAVELLLAISGNESE